MNNILEVNSLSYSIHKTKILDDISFYIPNSKICAFLGKNGAGKSTTIKCILGLIKNYHTSSGGGVTCDGAPTSQPKNRKFIGYVSENNVLPKLSSLSFLLEQATYIGLKHDKAISQIKEFCKALDFPYERLKISTSRLSAGLKKVVILIQALLGNPKLVIMDEPTTNLDFETRLLFYKLIIKLKNKGITFLISTHNFFEIKEFAN
jgi:ABC-type multidrug transport system ATPase subunit